VFPELVTVVVGAESSVSGRSPEPAEMNSVTVPTTLTASPTCTVGLVEPWKTKIPSEVEGSLSQFGSSM
jgi:hypothetical protein